MLNGNIKYIVFIIFLLFGINIVGFSQQPKNKDAEKAQKKRIKELEKEYKQALKFHRKIQDGRVNKRRSKHKRRTKRLKTDRKALFGNRVKGGSIRQKVRRQKTRERTSRLMKKVGNGLRKTTNWFGKGFAKIGDFFGNIKVPKIKLPKLFKRKK